MLAGSKIQRHSDPYAQHNQARHPEHRSCRGANGILPAGCETTSCLPRHGGTGDVKAHLPDIQSTQPARKYSIPADQDQATSR